MIEKIKHFILENKIASFVIFLFLIFAIIVVLDYMAFSNDFPGVHFNENMNPEWKDDYWYQKAFFATEELKKDVFFIYLKEKTGMFYESAKFYDLSSAILGSLAVQVYDDKLGITDYSTGKADKLKIDETIDQALEKCKDNVSPRAYEFMPTLGSNFSELEKNQKDEALKTCLFFYESWDDSYYDYYVENKNFKGVNYKLIDMPHGNNKQIEDLFDIE